MLDSLAKPDEAALAHPSANIVVFSLSIEEERDLRPADGIEWQKILAKIGFETGSLQKVQQRNINVQTLLAQGSKMSISPSIDTRDGWQVTARHAPSQAALYAGGVTLERASYPGFTIFRKEIESVCKAFSEVLKPSLRTRLGLRYSNALSSSEAKSAAFWQGKIEPAFLSVGGDSRLCSEFQRVLTVIDFSDADKDLALQVRSGLQPDVVHDGAAAFVFDIDVTHTGLVPFSLGSCLTDMDALNLCARKMFQAIVTPAQFSAMKGNANG